MDKHKEMWSLKQKADSQNVLELYIYGDVESDGYDWWTDEVIHSETSANHFRTELTKYTNVTEIEIYINSNGGSVFEGTAIYSQLRRHTAHKTVYIDGFACSIASVIAMAGDKVVMPRNTMMMVHHASMGCYGNASELRKAAEDLDKINEGNRQAYLQKAGNKLTEEKLIELLDNETFLTAEECIELGLADEFSEQNVNLEEMQKMLEKENLNISQKLKIRQSYINQLKQINDTQLPEEPKPQPKADDDPQQNNNLLFLFEKL